MDAREATAGRAPDAGQRLDSLQRLRIDMRGLGNVARPHVDVRRQNPLRPGSSDVRNDVTMIAIDTIRLKLTMIADTLSVA